LPGHVWVKGGGDKRRRGESHTKRFGFGQGGKKKKIKRDFRLEK